MLTLFLLLTIQSLFAQLKICPLFSNHAVLQRQKPLPVWGKANPNEEITVNFANESLKTVANTEGVWRVTFAPLEAGGPFDMTVYNITDTLKIKDILMGEVWLCSGQSNMGWRVSNADNYLKERKNTDYPQIRHFEVEHEVSLQLKTELTSGAWKIASAETVGAFSGVGFFFARDIYQKLNIPMGILQFTPQTSRMWASVWRRLL